MTCRRNFFGLLLSTEVADDESLNVNLDFIPEANIVFGSVSKVGLMKFIFWMVF